MLPVEVDLVVEINILDINMIELILFILLVYGSSYLIVESVIYGGLKDKIKWQWLNELISCMTCTSFWMGCAIHFLFPITPFFILSGIVALASMNLIGKFTSY